MLQPLARAFAQLDDPVFVGVLWRSLAWSAACFALLAAGSVWAVDRLLDVPGLWRWLADLLSVAGAALLALWLFLPVAAVIASLFFDRVANAVERRFYPARPQGRPAPFAAQMWDGLALGLRILALNVAALLLALLLPGVGLLLGWAIGAYAIGRGLFVAVAMRRMDRRDAERLYQLRRTEVLVQGGALAAAAYLPLVNLLIPVIGVACMVHVLDRARA
jgi:uncharacterized protein involved in cysteine biosynthesis